MATLKLDVGLNGPQLEAYQNLRAGMTIALAWGRGVGKSKFMRLCWWLLVAQYDGQHRGNTRGIKIIVLMPTLKQFRDVHGDGVIEDLEGDWAWLGGRLNRSRWSVTFPGGSWVKPFPAAEHASKASRGMRCDFICCDEADDVPSGVYDAVAIPWLSARWSLNMKMVSGTPRRGRKGLLYRSYKRGVDRRRNSYSSHATYRDVPEIVSAEVVEEARETAPPAIFKREWECDFDAAEGLVYGDVWDERFHVRTPPDGQVWTEMLIAGDSGWEHPGFMGLIGVIGKGADATCWLLREVYEQHQPDDFWEGVCREWMEWYPRATLYMDPAAAELIAKLKGRARARPGKVVKDVEEGIRSVATMLKIRGEGDERKARFYVHPRCKNTIWEFGSYKRKQDPTDPDLYLEDVVKKFDDAADGIRYALHSHFIETNRGPRGQRSLDIRQAATH